LRAQVQRRLTHARGSGGAELVSLSKQMRGAAGLKPYQLAGVQWLCMLNSLDLNGARVFECT
jgi:hypothetical protein